MSNPAHVTRTPARAQITIVHVDDRTGLQTWNTIANTTTDRPSTLEDLLGFVDRVPDQLRCIACVDGAPVATACAVPDARRPDAPVIVQIRVQQAHRRLGVGSALCEEVFTYLRARGARAFRMTVRDTAPDAIGFWERRGCREVDRDIVVALDLRDSDVPSTATQDVVITSLAERPDLLRSIYDVGAATWPDIPAHETEPTPSFEEWRTDIQGLEENRPEAIFAAQVEGNVVGYAHLALPPTVSHVGWHNFTGVRREHRGRGIARALKLHVIDWARRNGRHVLMTGNHENNDPMRHINESLGYRRLYAEISLEGRVP